MKQRHGRADIPPGRDLLLLRGVMQCPNLLSGEPRSAYFGWQSAHFAGTFGSPFFSV